MNETWTVLEEDASVQYGLKFPDGHIEWQNPGGQGFFDFSRPEMRARQRLGYEMQVRGSWIPWRDEYALRFVCRKTTQAVTETKEIK